MPDIIDVLERLGQDSRLRHLGGDHLAQVLVEARLETGARAAILSQDPQQIEAQLGAPPHRCCLVEDPEVR